MYDQAIGELINNAPIFGEFSLDELPKKLTGGYTDVVAARLRFDGQEHDIGELRELLDEVNKIALTYEAYVSLLGDRENCVSAAFIAASAHQLSYRIKSIIIEKDQSKSLLLSTLSIDSSISASLLFFISGYTADAAEMANNITITDENVTIKRLIIALKELLTGSIHPVKGNQPIYPSSEDWGDEVASDALWAQLHKGVNSLLSYLTTQGQDLGNEYQEAIRLFDQVIELSCSNEEISEGNVSLTFSPIFVGPRYLSNLLRVLAKFIPQMALINIDPPAGVQIKPWYKRLSEVAVSRPYLWPNHKTAIESGYLNQGVSSVVSFPTGGGKSTLSELKIAASILRNEPVIFIVPTLALVDQVAKSLKLAFPTVTTTLSFEEFGVEDIKIEVLPEISVMTPESCLVKMSFSPESFEKVGLFIFDECHLLHSKSNEIADRRSVDSMLCLLRITQLSNSVDVLLMSAMLENNEELANWLGLLLKREVLSLNVKWKPTRQAKGCVVYDSSRILELNRYVSKADRTKSKKLTAKAKRDLTVIPYSFFSLNQTWHSNQASDYKLACLSEERVVIGVNNYDNLVANRNKVAAKIAGYSAGVGIKTLVFAADKRACDSIVKNIEYFRTNGPIELTDAEQKLNDLISVEFGGDHSYFTKSSTALPHHGLLIKEERKLHESLFCRDAGVDLLVATSTLAQGINLPAECVIIAGNTRFDVQTDRQEELDAHELLNAAGRAGRAGQNSTGFVLVIPSKVVSFDAGRNKITKYWREVQDVFSQQDQCLTIEDPLQLVLDRLHEMPLEIPEDIRYFIQRLPADKNGNCSDFINRTFVAFQARVKNNETWISERIENANEVFSRIRKTNEEAEHSWYDKLAFSSGIPAEVIKDLHTDFTGSLELLSSPLEILHWYLNWMGYSLDRLKKFVRIETLFSAFGARFRNLNDEEVCQFFTDKLPDYLKLWVEGVPIRDLEIGLGCQENKLGKCDGARRFIIRVIPEIAYAAGVLSQVYRLHCSELNEEPSNLNLNLLNQLVRYGFDEPVKLALNNVIDDATSRVKTHTISQDLAPLLGEISPNDDFNSLMSTVGQVYRTWNKM